MRGFSLLLLAGCTDWDGDQLSNREERTLGLDPHQSDSDADDLDDAAEVALGTDPANADTDGDSLLDGAEHMVHSTDPLAIDTDDDGYRDPDEIAEGSDPTKAHSKIYQGGWPYYANKDGIDEGPTSLEFGERLQRFTLTDQYGQEVDLYDLYGSGPVALTVSPLYCPWVWELAAYLSGDVVTSEYARLWPAGPEVVARGDVRWVIVVPENLYSEPPLQEDLLAVADAMGAARGPVLNDGAFEFTDYAQVSFYPYTVLVDDGLVVQDPSVSGNGGTATLGDTVPVIAHLSKLFPE